MNHSHHPRVWSLFWALAGIFLLAMRFHSGRENVVLLSFAAQTSEEQITLGWETASELDVFAFRIQRCLPDGDLARCGREMDANYADLGENIVAKGDDATGAQYQSVDTDVESGVTYFYRLLVIDNLGDVSNIHGPVWGTPGASPTPTQRVTTPTITVATPTLGPYKGKIYLPLCVK